MKKINLALIIVFSTLLFGCEIGFVGHHKHHPHNNTHSSTSVVITPLTCDYDDYFYTLPYYDDPLVCYSDIDGYEYCEWTSFGYSPYSECLETWMYDDAYACAWMLLEEYCYPI